MKHSNEDLTSVSECAIEFLESAIDELAGIEEYRDIREDLKEIKAELEEKAEEYGQAYLKECEEERAYENAEYERSVL